ncbi:MAG: hypothetical protein PHQ33_05010 [Bacteroidales bacterium]|jgi:hypothetical protein|nr:hypothetical protein [Bacteroidales bacterium]MDD4395225.1 hypothetical protein [Bacteroidales bacterium]
MKNIVGLIAITSVILLASSCKRECVCVGSHPSVEQVEEHSFGKMSTDDCIDKQYRMNHDTTTTTTLFWICE